MFKAMSIKGKLLSGFGLVILLALTIGVIAIYSMVQAQKVGKDIYTLVNGDTVRILQSAGNSWYQISYVDAGGQSATGYMMGDYLSNT